MSIGGDMAEIVGFVCFQETGGCYCKPNTCSHSCHICKESHFLLQRKNYFGCQGESPPAVHSGSWLTLVSDRYSVCVRCLTVNVTFMTFCPYLFNYNTLYLIPFPCLRDTLCLRLGWGLHIQYPCYSQHSCSSPADRLPV